MNSGAEAAFYAVLMVLTIAGLLREWHAQYVVTILAVMYVISAAAIVPSGPGTALSTRLVIASRQLKIAARVRSIVESAAPSAGCGAP